ncbi:tandem-95 repeat protein, partial [bacterium]|nr:tandem-95 repeat protein [bacterium]
EGAYLAVFTISDGEFAVEAEVIITVGDVNLPPTWDDVPDNAAVNEAVELVISVVGSDPDGDDISIAYSSNDIPEAADFTDHTDGTGTFTWTPTYDDAGDYTATFTISDDEFNVATNVQITVNNMNRPPVWDNVPGNEIVLENNELTFAVDASDPDGDNLSLRASSDDLPDGWGFTDNEDGSGLFEWTPGYDDAGNYSLTLFVSDGAIEVDEQVTITVSNVNRVPVWEEIPESVQINEDQLLEIIVLASDPDGDDLSFNTFSDDLPEGWTFSGSRLGRGTFRWTPTFDDAGEYTLFITVSDGQDEIEGNIIIVVNHVNRAPVWENLTKSYEVDEMQELQFTSEASDPDGDDFVLDALSDDLPEGWEFVDNDDGTGTFTWTPNYGDEGVYQLNLIVSDGQLDVVEDIEITVNGVNRAPVWDVVPENVVIDEAEELSFVLEASDPDGDDLTLRASSGNLPEGWDFRDNMNATGTFTWIPGYDDSGEYLLSVFVSDGEVEVEAEVSIRVNHVNRSPEWVEIPQSMSVNENELLEFTVEGSDPDGDDLTIGYSSEDLPDAVNFNDNRDGTASFSWRPGDDDTGAYSAIFTLSDNEFSVVREVIITVGDVNHPPVWDAIPVRVEVDEDSELSFTVEGSDPDGDDLTIDYNSDDIPEAADFTDNTDGTGMFVWTPTYDDAGNYTAIFTISDVEFNIVREVAITVNNVNRSPEWMEIPERVEINEDQLLEFTVEGSDPDNDDLIIVYSSDNIPETADFTDNTDGTGMFVWTPSYDDAGQYSATFTLSDGEATIEEQVVIIVNNVNRSPVWDNVPQEAVGPGGELLQFIVEGSDPDGDELSIGYRSDDLPEAADFTDNGNGSGLFEWTPQEEETGDYTAIFTISDDEYDVDIEVIIRIGDYNRDPVITQPNEGNEYVLEDLEREVFRIEFAAEDPENDDLSWEMIDLDEALPDGWVFTDNGDGTALFNWETEMGDYGEYFLLFRVTDGNEGSDEMQVILVVRPQSPPFIIIEPFDDMGLFFADVNENEELSIHFVAESPYGNDGFWEILDIGGIPDGWVFTDNGDLTADFVWTPGFDDAGGYEPVFAVSDGDEVITTTGYITVHNVNRPPVVVNPIADIEIDEDSGEIEVADLDNVFDDPDGDELSYAIISGANELRLSIDEQTNILTLEPSLNYFGESEAVIEADDGQGEARQVAFSLTQTGMSPPPRQDGSSIIRTIRRVLGMNRSMPRRDDAETDRFMVNVLPVNDPPIIYNSQGEEVGEGIEITVDENEEIFAMLRAIDVDDNSGDLNWELIDEGGLPEGWVLDIIGNGMIAFVWTPGLDDGRDELYTPSLRVTDPAGLFDEVEFVITVVNVNREPVWDEPDPAVTINSSFSEELVFRIVTHDPDGDNLTIRITERGGLPEEAGFNDNGDGTADFVWQPTVDDVGEYNPTFSVSDAEANVEVSLTIIIEDNNRPEVIRPIADVEIDEDSGVFEVADLDEVFEDPDGDEMSFYVVSGSEELNLLIDEETHVLTLEPALNYNGVSEVVIAASDDLEQMRLVMAVQFGSPDDHSRDRLGREIRRIDDRSGETPQRDLSVETGFTVTVNPVNDPPYWEDTPGDWVFTLLEEMMSFELTAGDVDVDEELILEMTDRGGLPEEAEFTDNGGGSGSFTWQTTIEDEGEYNAVFTVSDGEESTALEIRLVVSELIEQTIQMNFGWSLISINILPTEDYYDVHEDRGPSIPKMIETFINDDDEQLVFLLKDEMGDFCLPEWGYYGIRYWDLQEAYYFKINAEWEPHWIGEPIPADAPIRIDPGWNMIPYYPNYELPADEASDFYAFSSIIDNIIIVKNGYGEFISPRNDYSNMRPCVPGMGFQINLNDNAILEYPEPYQDAALAPSRRMNAYHHWFTLPSTGENMSVLINSIRGVRVEDGDQIAAFRLPPTGMSAFPGNSELVGVGTVSNGRCGLAVWGDDVTTKDVVDGLLAGAAFELRFWDASKDVESAFEVTIKEGSDLLYSKNALIVLEGHVTSSIPDEYYMSQNYPNPFNAVTRIVYGLPEAGDVSIRVYDITGHLMTTLVNGEHKAGRYTADWNGLGTASGLYIVRMDAGDFKSVRKVMLVK